MALDLVNYKQKARAAVKAFWGQPRSCPAKAVLAGHIAAEAARLG